MRASAVLFGFCSVLAAAQAAPLEPVYRVDQATAVIDGSHLVVTAKGAVRTGGWEHPRLIVRRTVRTPGDVEVEFVASPPEDSAAVVQSIVPMNVSMKTRLPKTGVAAVRVVSETNSVTAEIIPKTDRQRTARR